MLDKKGLEKLSDDKKWVVVSDQLIGLWLYW